MGPAREPEDEADELNLSPKAIVGILVGAVLLVVVLIFLSSGDDSETGSDQASDSPPTSAAGPTDSGPKTSVPQGTTKPTTPAGPKVPTGGPEGPPTDDFNQADGPLSPPWMVIGGWVREGGVLSLKAPTEGLNQIAVRDVGSANSTVSAVVVGIPNRSGLAFRYKDQENYWFLSPALNYATWTLHKVVAGDISPVANTGFSSAAKNTTVTVVTNGPDIRVRIDGVEVLATTNETHQDATMAGFVVVADDLDSVKWDNFYAIAS